MSTLATATTATLANCELASFTLTGPHRLSLRFRDGFVTELDFSDYGTTGGSLKQALRDETLFAEAFLAYGILSWPHGYDLAPETLRRYAEQGYVG